MEIEQNKEETPIYNTWIKSIPDILLVIGYVLLTITSFEHLWKSSVNPLTSIRNVLFIMGFGCIGYGHYLITTTEVGLHNTDGYYQQMNLKNSDIFDIIRFGNVSVVFYAIISIIQSYMNIEPKSDIVIVQNKLSTKHYLFGLPIDAYGTLMSHGLLMYAIFNDTMMNVSLPFYILSIIMLYNAYHTSYDISGVIQKMSVIGSSSLAIGYAGILINKIIK